MKKIFLSAMFMIIILAAAASAKPSISAEVNGVRLIPGDAISSTPRINITVNTASGPARGTIEVGGVQTILTFTQVGNNYYAVHNVTTPLANGIQTITIRAGDAGTVEAIFELTPLYVQNNHDLTVQSPPLCYPNPFDPGNTATPTATIGYTLSKQAALTLYIYDPSGLLIYQKSSRGDDGGGAGYNTITWDGRAGNGSVAGNGIYVFLLISEGNLVGKGKVTVLKR
jgi:hypothetical protein